VLILVQNQLVVAGSNIMLEFEPEQALNLTIMRLGKDAYVEMKYVVTLGKLN